MHALFALARGASVVHLERDAVPSGATVRNFGLDLGEWPSRGSASSRWRCALANSGRTSPKDVPGVGFRANGSITLINDVRELEVAQRAICAATRRSRRSNCSAPEEIVRTQPRRCKGSSCRVCTAVATPPSSRARRSARCDLHGEHRSLRVLAGTRTRGRHDHAAIDHRGVHSPAVTTCALSRSDVERLRGRAVRAGTAAQGPTLHGRDRATRSTALTTSVANGDSFRYYPGFRRDATEFLDDQPSRRRLRDPTSLSAAPPRRTDHRRHARARSAGPLRDAAIDRWTSSKRPRDGSSGPTMPAIERRWSGVYHQVVDPPANEIYFRKQVARRSQRGDRRRRSGMTLAPAIAEESFL
jgi:hypothetical protein